MLFLCASELLECSSVKQPDQVPQARAIQQKLRSQIQGASYAVEGRALIVV